MYRTDQTGTRTDRSIRLIAGESPRYSIRNYEVPALLLKKVPTVFRRYDADAFTIGRLTEYWPQRKSTVSSSTAESMERVFDGRRHSTEKAMECAAV